MALNQNFTVKNNLNTLGSILSSGVDIATTFATNTLVQTTSALLTPLTTTNNLTGQLVKTTDFTSYQTTVANATATLLPTSTFTSYQTTVANATATLLPTSTFTSYQTTVANATAALVSTVNGTINQISATASNGVVTLSLPNSITTPGNLTVGGNLYVTGSATQVNQNTLNIGTPIIYLAEDNPADAYDIGFVGHNVIGGVYGHTGLLRTHGTGNPGTWYLFSSMSTEPSGNSVATNSKTIDTLVANLSGNATTATTLQTARNFSLGSGDVTSPTVSFNGSADVSLATTIASNAVTYSKFQQVAANSVVGNPTGSTANAQAIPASTTGLALLSATSASAAAAILGIGSTNVVTVSSLIISNGSQTNSNNIFYGTTTTNVLTVPTFNKTTYNTAKYVVQIKRFGGASAAMEILVNYNTGNTTWEGTVYGLLDTGSIFTNVDVATTGSTIDLSFTFNGNATYNVTVIGQAM